MQGLGRREGVECGVEVGLEGGRCTGGLEGCELLQALEGRGLELHADKRDNREAFALEGAESAGCGPRGEEPDGALADFDGVAEAQLLHGAAGGVLGAQDAEVAGEARGWLRVLLQTPDAEELQPDNAPACSPEAAWFPSRRDLAALLGLAQAAAPGRQVGRCRVCGFLEEPLDKSHGRELRAVCRAPEGRWVLWQARRRRALSPVRS